MSETPTVQTVMDSPLGPLTVVAGDDGLTAVYMQTQRHRPEDDRLGPGVAPDAPAVRGAVRQLQEYFAGSRTSFDLALAPQGTPFQRSVWQALRDVPFGTTVSYGTIAERLGLAPGASRAVGAAVGRNPLAVVVPCHRVVGASGSLTGYAGGLDRKVWLLEHEGAALAAR